MGLVFDGVDLKQQFGFNVTKVDGRGSPPVSSNKLTMPHVDGAVILDSKFDARKISITGYLYGRSPEEAAQKKDAMIRLISTAYNSEKKLQFPDTGRYIYVRLAGDPIVIGPIGPVFGAYAYEISLNFEAVDPFFYGEDFNYSGAGFVFSVDADAPIYLISPRREFLEHEPNVTIYPVTLVNLLGKYGDFETDSNGDGWADGWIASASITSGSMSTGVIGSYAQEVVMDNTAGTDSAFYNIASPKIFVSSGHVLFVSGYVYEYTDTTSDYTRLRIYEFDSTGAVVKYTWLPKRTEIGAELGQWFRTYTKVVLDVSTTFILAMISPVALAGQYTHIKVDGYSIYDLTAMGALPPALQDYYGVTNWSDLDADTLAELLVPCNGICTLGFTWAGDL